MTVTSPHQQNSPHPQHQHQHSQSLNGSVSVIANPLNTATITASPMSANSISASPLPHPHTTNSEPASNGSLSQLPWTNTHLNSSHLVDDLSYTNAQYNLSMVSPHPSLSATEPDNDKQLDVSINYVLRNTQFGWSTADIDRFTELLSDTGIKNLRCVGFMFNSTDWPEELPNVVRNYLNHSFEEAGGVKKRVAIDQDGPDAKRHAGPKHPLDCARRTIAEVRRIVDTKGAEEPNRPSQSQVSKIRFWLDHAKHAQSQPWPPSYAQTQDTVEAMSILGEYMANENGHMYRDLKKLLRDLGYEEKKHGRPKLEEDMDQMALQSSALPQGPSSPHLLLQHHMTEQESGISPLHRSDS